MADEDVDDGQGRGRATVYGFWLRFREKPWARRSLLIFPRDALIRRICIALTQSKWFGYFVQLLIVSNCFSMMLIDPLKPEAPINAVLNALEWGFTILFTAECILQIIAAGLIVPDPNCGRETEVFTLRDWLGSGLGCRRIPPIRIGNVHVKASGMSRSRLRSIVEPFYEDDDGASSSKALLEQLDATCRAKGKIEPDVTQHLAASAWTFLPQPFNLQFLACISCFELLQEIYSDVQLAIKRNGQQKSGVDVLKERILELAAEEVESAGRSRRNSVRRPSSGSTPRRNGGRRPSLGSPNSSPLRVRRRSLASPNSSNKELLFASSEEQPSNGVSKEAGKELREAAEELFAQRALDASARRDPAGPSDDQQVNLEAVDSVVDLICNELLKQVEKAASGERRGTLIFDGEALMQQQVHVHVCMCMCACACLTWYDADVTCC